MGFPASCVLMNENAPGPAKLADHAVKKPLPGSLELAHDEEFLHPSDSSNQWLESCIAVIFRVELTLAPEALDRQKPFGRSGYIP